MDSNKIFATVKISSRAGTGTTENNMDSNKNIESDENVRYFSNDMDSRKIIEPNEMVATVLNNMDSKIKTIIESDANVRGYFKQYGLERKQTSSWERTFVTVPNGMYA